MTEFELMVAFQGTTETWMGAASLFLSVLFGYIVTAYLVAAKLSRSQIVVITLLYSVFCLGLMVAMYGIQIRLGQFASEILEINPERDVPTNRPGEATIPLAFSATFFGAYIAGLVFMFQSRRRAKR